MSDDIYHMIKNLKKVSGFLGSKGTPVPVSDKEIEKILGEIKDGVVQPKSGIDYAIGEKVQVIDGPFASFSGLVEEIDEDKKHFNNICFCNSTSIIYFSNFFCKSCWR